MLRIGSGAGFSGDRLEPALLLAQSGKLDYLVLECLAERTIALAQKRKQKNEKEGYDLLLEKRIELLLPSLHKHSVRLITNMGAANPIEAAKKVVEIAKKLNIPVKVAAVTGDDVFHSIDLTTSSLETNEPLYSYQKIVSANAYIGIEGIISALETEADIIVTGRAADPSLFLAPIVHHYGWSLTDYNKLGQGTVIGHLLECGGQVAGGYFADPVKKPVQDLDTLGFPYAEIEKDGRTVIRKLEGTGGEINLATVKEQLLYEVLNPYEYITPDVRADFTSVHLEQVEKDAVLVYGGSGSEKPENLKVSVGYHAGFIGEGEISYGGEHALKRAELAGEVIGRRLKNFFPDLQIDYIGCSSLHYSSFNHRNQPYEVRMRVAGRTDTLERARLIGEEVEALYTNGPAGGGGARKYAYDVIGIVSSFIPRDKVKLSITVEEHITHEKTI